MSGPAQAAPARRAEQQIRARRAATRQNGRSCRKLGRIAPYWRQVPSPGERRSAGIPASLAGLHPAMHARELVIIVAASERVQIVVAMLRLAALRAYCSGSFARCSSAAGVHLRSRASASVLEPRADGDAEAALGSGDDDRLAGRPDETLTAGGDTERRHG